MTGTLVRHPSAPAHDAAKETTTIARRLCAEFPDIAPQVVTDRVEVAYASLGTARIQAFRSILAERSARRRLTAPPIPARHDSLSATVTPVATRNETEDQ